MNHRIDLVPGRLVELITPSNDSLVLVLDSKGNFNIMSSSNMLLFPRDSKRIDLIIVRSEQNAINHKAKE